MINKNRPTHHRTRICSGFRWSLRGIGNANNNCPLNSLEVDLERRTHALIVHFLIVHFLIVHFPDLFEQKFASSELCFYPCNPSKSETQGFERRE
jgi:hypothetical protein